jgi:hypothetical protein
MPAQKKKKKKQDDEKKEEDTLDEEIRNFDRRIVAEKRNFNDKITRELKKS